MRASSLFVLFLLLWTPVGVAEAPSHLQRTQAELRRITRLVAPNAREALLEQARRALAAAENAARQGREAEAERALAIADSAMILWNARRDREQARAATAAAERRATAAEARVDVARHALAVVRAQRRAHDEPTATDGGSAETGAAAADGGSDGAP